MIDVTNRTSVTSKYFSELRKYKILTRDEELDLFKQYRAGDETAREKIILHNLKFVISVAKQYQHYGVFLDDLISEGNKGLIEAIEGFDHTRGFKFISYAVWSIKKYIKLHISETAQLIRTPTNLQKTQNKLYFEQLKKSQLDQDFPFTQTKLIITSLTANNLFPEELCLSDSLKDESSDFLNKYDNQLDESILKAFKTLTDIERDVIFSYYGLRGKEKDTEELTIKLGCCRQNVNEIKKRALRKIRSSLNRQQRPPREFTDPYAYEKFLEKYRKLL